MRVRTHLLYLKAILLLSLVFIEVQSMIRIKKALHIKSHLSKASGCLSAFCRDRDSIKIFSRISISETNDISTESINELVHFFLPQEPQARNRNRCLRINTYQNAINNLGRDTNIKLRTALEAVLNLHRELTKFDANEDIVKGDLTDEKILKKMNDRANIKMPCQQLLSYCESLLVN